MTLFEKIDLLGDPIAQHHFAGTFDGTAVVLYQIDGSTIGTHFVAVLEASGPIQIMPIMDEESALKAFRGVVDGVHATQNA